MENYAFWAVTRTFYVVDNNACGFSNASLDQKKSVGSKVYTPPTGQSTTVLWAAIRTRLRTSQYWPL